MAKLIHRIWSGSRGVPSAMSKMPAPTKVRMNPASMIIWTRMYFTALRTVRANTTSPVETSWRATTPTTAAPTSTSCIRSRYWRRNACQAGSLASSASLSGP